MVKGDTVAMPERFIVAGQAEDSLAVKFERLPAELLPLGLDSSAKSLYIHCSA